MKKSWGKLKLRVKGFWGELSEFWRKFAVGGVLAVVLHIVVPPGGPLAGFFAGLAGDTVNRFSDWLISNDWQERHTNSSGHLAPIVILDIDDQTYRDWGEPRITPRDKLAELIDRSLKANAKAVVVDIDLSGRGPVDASDAKLQSVVLGEIREAVTKHRATRLVLARRVVHDSNSRSWIRKTYLEPFIVGKGLALQAGTTTFIRDQDQIIRRWRLVQTTCADGKGDAAHSLQLLAAAVLYDAQDTVAVAQETLAKSACRTDPDELAAQAREPIHLSSKFKIPLDDESLTARMRFTFDFVHHRNGDLTPISGPGSQPTLLILPATLALQYPSEHSVKALRGAIVLIGATHFDSEDFHATPVGEMPGVLLVANAIYSLLDQGVMKLPHWFVVLPVESAFVLLLAAVFTLFSLRFTLWISLSLGFVLLFLVALLLYYFGVWFDYVTPMLGPVAHQILERHVHRS